MLCCNELFTQKTPTRKMKTVLVVSHLLFLHWMVVRVFVTDLSIPFCMTELLHSNRELCVFKDERREGKVLGAGSSHLGSQCDWY